jgi:hypothetical protein
MKTYKYTIKDLAEAGLVTEETVKRDIRQFRLHPSDIVDVARWITVRRLQKRILFDE